MIYGWRAIRPAPTTWFSPQALRCDLFRYFPSIDHAILKAEFRRRVASPAPWRYGHHRGRHELAFPGHRDYVVISFGGGDRIARNRFVRTSILSYVDLR
jgi:hypothetical protein